MYLPSYLPSYLATYLPIYLCTYQPIYRCTYLPINLPTHLPIDLSIHLSIFPSIHLFFHPSIHLSIDPSVHLSIHASIHPSICKEATLRDFLKKWNFTAPKRGKSARHPQKFDIDNVENEAILRAFCKLQMGCRADGLAPMRFVMFPPHLSEVLPLPWKSEARSYEVLHLSRKIILANLQIWCSKAQPLSGNLQLNFQKCSDHQWLSTRSCTLSLTLIFFLLMLSSLTLYLLWLFSQVLLHLSIRRKFDFEISFGYTACNWHHLPDRDRSSHQGTRKWMVQYPRKNVWPHPGLEFLPLSLPTGLEKPRCCCCCVQA